MSDTKLTPEMVKKLCDARRRGLKRDAAAEAAGIHRTTLQRWYNHGIDGLDPYTIFVREWTRAEQEFLDRETGGEVGGNPARAHNPG